MGDSDYHELPNGYAGVEIITTSAQCFYSVKYRRLLLLMLKPCMTVVYYSTITPKASGT